MTDDVVNAFSGPPICDIRFDDKPLYICKKGHIRECDLIVMGKYYCAICWGNFLDETIGASERYNGEDK